MADRTIGGLQEAPIGALPGIADLYDDSLLPVEQQGEARKMTGAQWKRYAQAGVESYVDGAKASAEAAASSAAAAAKSAENAAGSAGEAAGSAQSAKEYSGKPPVIRDGTWWTWNAERKEYVDTGEAARGERGDVGPPGIQGMPGDQGIQGEPGAGIQSIDRTGGDGSPGTVDTYTITMTDGSEATFSVYNGADGTSFTVLGRYGTLDELIEAHPVGSEGDAWAVGSAEDNDVYLWNVDTQAWQNVGSLQGPPGPAGTDGTPGRDGADGKSAYQIAVDGGFSGDEEEWLASLKGKDGAQGADGTQGPAGADGKTAYQYAVDGGYTGSEEEFRALMGSGPWLPLEGGTITGDVIFDSAGLRYSPDWVGRVRPWANKDSGGSFGGGALLFESNENCDSFCVGLSVQNGMQYPCLYPAPSSKPDMIWGARVRIRNIEYPINAFDVANKAYVDSKAGGVPAGVIVMWSGAISAIPAGWALCNGSNGTPDLRNRFIVGAGSSYSVGATGGSEMVTLTIAQMPSHNHNYDAPGIGSRAQYSASGTYFFENTYSRLPSQYAGGNQAHENRPPYYALCFIMKL